MHDLLGVKILTEQQGSPLSHYTVLSTLTSENKLKKGD